MTHSVAPHPVGLVKSPPRPALALKDALDLIFAERPELVEKLYALALLDGCDVTDLIIDAVEAFFDELAGPAPCMANEVDGVEAALAAEVPQGWPGRA
jgi:hypothetical protein